ncbi:MAG: hypothetical protein WBI72_03235 [bacterium]
MPNSDFMVSIVEFYLDVFTGTSKMKASDNDCGVPCHGAVIWVYFVNERIWLLIFLRQYRQPASKDGKHQL